MLRSPPGAPTTQNVLLHIERLEHIRSLELRSDLGQLIHQNRLLQLAREGVATTSQQLGRFDDPRRYGTLIAVLLEANSTLTDEILDLHDRFVSSSHSMKSTAWPPAANCLTRRSARAVSTPLTNTVPEEASVLMRRAYEGHVVRQFIPGN
jgi:hypothetical protein